MRIVLPKAAGVQDVSFLPLNKKKKIRGKHYKNVQKCWAVFKFFTFLNHSLL